MTTRNKYMDNTWLYFALLTVLFWGVYGVLLHEGQSAIGDKNPEMARYKSFLWVGAAYFLVAIIAPAVLIVSKGGGWQMDGKGIAFSLIAGIAGAIGAFGVLLALSAKGGTPPAVMSIIFAGAPIVNALVSLALHPPAGGWGQIKWQFWFGMLLAILGAFIVTKNKPAPAKKAASRQLPAGYEDVTKRKYEIC